MFARCSATPHIVVNEIMSTTFNCYLFDYVIQLNIDFKSKQ